MIQMRDVPDWNYRIGSVKSVFSVTPKMLTKMGIKILVRVLRIANYKNPLAINMTPKSS